MVSHITYWDCRVLIFSEYLSRNSCICYSSLNIPLHYIPAPKNNPCAKKLLILLQIHIYRNNPPKSHLHHWFPHKLTSEKWVQNFYTDVACKKALRVLWQRGGKREESLQLHLWNLNSASSSPVAPRQLSCHGTFSSVCMIRASGH